MARFKRVLGITLLVVAWVIRVSAQTDTATITGIILDPTGAAAPNTSVEVVNQANGLKYRAVTNPTGVYVVAVLPVGVYDIAVSLAGFEKIERREVALHAGDRARIDFQLKVGAVNQVMDVSSRAPLLESETSSLGQAIENATITQMPLNGRNYQQLAMLAPGVVPSRTTNFVTDAFSVNGASMLQNNFVMDGMDNNNYSYGVVIASNEVIKPSIDAIQEFKTETHNFSAEFGRGGGAVVQVTTRSGGNNFHGTAFEFVRNNVFDANDFFNSGRPKPAYRQNQFGGTFGGPVRKNKTFFFASYQGTQIRNHLTFLSVLPTTANVQGNFGSTAIYDPATQDASGNRQAFPNNQIPASRFDPVAIRELQLYPAPNRAGVQNYVFNPSQNDRDHEVDSRLDHRFREKDTLFLRYSFHDRNRLEPGNLPLPASGGNTALRQAKAHTAVLSETHIFGSGNIVNEARLAYARNAGKIDVPTTEKLWQQFGFLGTFFRSDINGVPLFNLAGLTSVGDRSSAPDPKDVDVRQLVDNLSWFKGRHSMKMGVDVHLFTRYAGTTNFARGVYAFNGQFTSARAGVGTGPSFADSLLGLTSDAFVSNAWDDSLRAPAYGLYYQDDFKVNARLSLNLGLRYEYQQPFVEHNNRFANFVSIPGQPGYGTLVSIQGDSVEQRSFQKRDFKDFAPRVGLAYQLNPVTVIRAGYGIFYDTNTQTPFTDLTVPNPPFYLQPDIPTANSSATSNLIIRNGFPSSVFNYSGSLTGLSLFSAWPYSMPVAMTNQWNLNVQRTLPGAMVLSAAYVGSNTAHRHLGAQDINQPFPGPGALNPRRRFPDLATVTTSVPFGTANYQALEVKVERRFSRGFATLNGFTWSHSLSTDVGLNSRDLQREKGNSAQDLRKRFFSTVIWDLPFGAGKHLAASGLVSRIVGGWQVSTLFTAQNGLYYTPGYSGNTANSTGGSRPDRIGNGNLPGGQRSPDRWFDTSAFVAAAPFVFGNTGNDIIQGPGLVNLDSTVSRHFKLTEKLKLDFRAEFFNILNNPHFSAPNLTVNVAAGGTISSSLSPSREIQFGMKILF